mgnify:CR=1 FL=1
MKIVCIGNSIVNGYPHRRSQCFASLLRQVYGHEVINKGVNGDITPNVYARFGKDVISHKPDAVVILTGTNDFIYQVCSPEEAMGWLDKMSVLAKENSIEVILMTPLLVDASLASQRWTSDVDYDVVNEKLKSLRKLMLDYGDQNGVRIADAQEYYRSFYTEDTASDYLLDGLHPTVPGHEAIAGFMARFLQD